MLQVLSISVFHAKKFIISLELYIDIDCMFKEEFYITSGAWDYRSQGLCFQNQKKKKEEIIWSEKKINPLENCRANYRDGMGRAAPKGEHGMQNGPHGVRDNPVLLDSWPGTASH